MLFQIFLNSFQLKDSYLFVIFIHVLGLQVGWKFSVVASGRDKNIEVKSRGKSLTLPH